MQNRIAKLLEYGDKADEFLRSLARFAALLRIRTVIGKSVTPNRQQSPKRLVAILIAYRVAMWYNASMQSEYEPTGIDTAVRGGALPEGGITREYLSLRRM